MRCFCLLLLLATPLTLFAQREGWRTAPGAEDLIITGGWSCLGAVEASPAGVVLRTAAGFSTPVNQRLRLEPGGDFSVRGRLRIRSGAGAFTLVGESGQGEWWRGLKRLDLAITASAVEVQWWTGDSSANTTLRLGANPDGPLDFEIARIGGELAFFTKDGELGRIPDPGLFAKNQVFAGLNGYPNSEIVLESLSAAIPEGATLTLGGIRPRTAARNDSSLRAASQGLMLGGAIATNPLLTRADYAETAGREFNVLVAENDMKFGPIHPARGRYAYCAADDILAFAEANQMKVRGHTLVWHQQNPRWLDEGTFTREELLEVMREHISTVMGRYKGRVFAWDVVNESFAYGPPYGWMPSIWQRVLGTPDYIDAAFRFAREADPDALLFYNETGAETPGAKADRVYELLKGMKERGVPLDGVGFQMHVEALRPPSREALMRNFARFAELGIEIHVTEMDVRSPLPATAEKLDAEARVYRDVTAVCRATPRCTAILTWGVTDAISWIPGLYPNHLPGLLFDAAYQPKPSYQAVKDILGQN